MICKLYSILSPPTSYTLWGRVTYMRVSKLKHRWMSVWLVGNSTERPYLYQCLFFAKLALLNKLGCHIFYHQYHTQTLAISKNLNYKKKNILVKWPTAKYLKFKYCKTKCCIHIWSALSNKCSLCVVSLTKLSSNWVQILQALCFTTHRQYARNTGNIALPKLWL